MVARQLWGLGMLLLLRDRRNGAGDAAQEVGFFSHQQCFLCHKLSVLRRSIDLVVLHGPRHVNANACDAIVFLVTFSVLPSETMSLRGHPHNFQGDQSGA